MLSNFEEKVDRNFKIIHAKRKQLTDFKLDVNGAGLFDQVTRYQLNMELLVWLVNTDSLFYMHNPAYRKAKEAVKWQGIKKGIDTLATDKETENFGMMLGLYYAFNSFKHNLEVVDFERIIEVENTFTKSLSKATGNNYTMASNEWVQSEDLKGENILRFYSKYLVGKNVLDIFDAAFNFLQKQYQEYLKVLIS